MWRTAAIATLLVGLSHAAAAQQPAHSCSYDDCALRIEGARLVAGRDARSVMRVSMFGAPGLEAHVARSDSAVQYARLFQRRQQNATVLQLLGAAASVAWFFALADEMETSFDGREPSATLSTVLVGASLAGGILGAFEANRARTALARAVWWHNRELTR